MITEGDIIYDHIAPYSYRILTELDTMHPELSDDDLKEILSDNIGYDKDHYLINKLFKEWQNERARINESTK